MLPFLALPPHPRHSSIQARYSPDPPAIATFTISGVSYAWLALMCCSSAAYRRSAVFIVSRTSGSAHTSPFHRYTLRIDSICTHAASPALTIDRASSSACPSVATVVKTMTQLFSIETLSPGLRSPNQFIRQSCQAPRSEEHTSELQSRQYLVCRLLLEKK